MSVAMVVEGDNGTTGRQRLSRQWQPGVGALDPTPHTHLSVLICLALAELGAAPGGHPLGHGVMAGGLSEFSTFHGWKE